eukprot:2846515-Alexandrium_andersonii.AAC.1
MTPSSTQPRYNSIETSNADNCYVDNKSSPGAPPAPTRKAPPARPSSFLVTANGLSVQNDAEPPDEALQAGN